MFIWSSKWQTKKVFDNECIQLAVEWLYIQMDVKLIDSLRHIHNYCQNCTCLICRCYQPDCFCFSPFFLLITFIVNLRGEALASGVHYCLMDSTLHTVWTFCTQISATAQVNAVITSSKNRHQRKTPWSGKFRQENAEFYFHFDKNYNLLSFASFSNDNTIDIDNFFL